LDKIVELPTTRIIPDPNAPPTSFEEMCLRITAEAIALCIDKQKDYGPGNIAAFGEMGVLIRLNDKVERLKNLLRTGNEPTNESLEDTWIDILNYGMIGLAVHRKWWNEQGCPPLADPR